MVQITSLTDKQLLELDKCDLSVHWMRCNDPVIHGIVREIQRGRHVQLLLEAEVQLFEQCQKTSQDADETNDAITEHIARVRGVLDVTKEYTPRKEVDPEPNDADKALADVLAGLEKGWSVRLFDDESAVVMDAEDCPLWPFKLTGDLLTEIRDAIEECKPKPTRKQSLELIAEWVNTSVVSHPGRIRAALERIKETKEES